MHIRIQMTLGAVLFVPCLACAPRVVPGGERTSQGVEQLADLKLDFSIASLTDLRDQNDSGIEPPPRGQPWVIVLGDRRLSKETQAWADKLEIDLGNENAVVRVLSLAGVPQAAAAPLIRRGIKSQVGSKPIQVLLDWDGVVAKQFELSPEEPRVVCFRSSNTFVGVISGSLTDSNLQAVHELLAHSNENKLEIAR